MPTLSITGFQTVAPLAKQAAAENTYQLVDQLTFVSGKHTIKGGVEYRPQQYNAIVPAQFGSYGFTGFATGNRLGGFPAGQFRKRRRATTCVRRAMRGSST